MRDWKRETVSDVSTQAKHYLFCWESFYTALQLGDEWLAISLDLPSWSQQLIRTVEWIVDEVPFVGQHEKLDAKKSFKLYDESEKYSDALGEHFDKALRVIISELESSNAKPDKILNRLLYDFWIADIGGRIDALMLSPMFDSSVYRQHYEEAASIFQAMTRAIAASIEAGRSLVKAELRDQLQHRAAMLSDEWMASLTSFPE